MQKIDGISVENRLPNGDPLFAINPDGSAINVGLIVVDTRIGQTIIHKESGATYTLGIVVEYPHGEAFAAFGLNGVEDIIAPAVQFSFVGGTNEQ